MRIVLFILLVVLAAILGGLYGALYDQFTYSISNEFFAKRFALEGLGADMIPRWEVAKTGFVNTWSVGFWLGIFLSLAGLLHQDNKKMFYTTVQAFLIALGTGFLFGIVAYFLAEPAANIASEIEVKDKASFNKVLSMNNYSYVGGVIGMFLGLGWQVLKTRTSVKNSKK